MMKNTIHALYALEQWAAGDTVIHRRHPAAKLITTVVFLITVVSFHRYAVGPLVPYIFYPTLLMAFSETPYTMLLKRWLLALPFCLFAGITNVCFDTAPAFVISGFTVSYGLVSFCGIMLKTYLCVMAVLLLVAVTPFPALANEMRRLKIPGIFVTLFEMTYRYLGVLFDEAQAMYTAYMLRSVKRRGIDMKDMGSFVGQLLLRSFDRAERVYHAMQCRGYTARALPHNDAKMSRSDIAYTVLVCALCLAFRVLKERF